MLSKASWTAQLQIAWELANLTVRMMILCYRVQPKKAIHVKHLMQQTMNNNFLFWLCMKYLPVKPKLKLTYWKRLWAIFLLSSKKLWQFFHWSKTWAVAMCKRNSINSSSNTGGKFYQKWGPIQKLSRNEQKTVLKHY